MADKKRETPQREVPDPKDLPRQGEDGPEAALTGEGQDWIWALLQGPLEPYVSKMRGFIAVSVGLYALGEETGINDAVRGRLSKLGKRFKR